tara:strand:+ start:3725 stop:4264 length:540 start_codon:yes stop_codon:yes gene_type:complete
MIEMNKKQEAGETPAQITVSMIDQDLKNGVNKTEMSVKYGIKSWEVERMFEHPLLKGRRPSRRKPLSFSFVDDISADTSEPEFAKRAVDLMEEVEVNPNQVTLEQAIDDAIETVENVKAELVETERSVLDILSPTEFETSDDELEIPSFNDTMSVVEEQEWEKSGQEEELEMNDETFEL